MNNQYIADVPALKRKIVCSKCGNAFFKREKYQTICEDCQEEIVSQNSLEEIEESLEELGIENEIEAEQGEEAKREAFESSRGV